MRRIALTLAVLIAAVAWWLTSLAGADDSHTYKIEMYNAFGLVTGSDVRVGGVNAGSVTDLGIDSKKRAVVTVDLSGPLAVLGKDSTCASEPQSLIAEYFIDCAPKGPPLPDGGEIPASQVTQTVQPDLVADSLRQSYRDRLGMIIDEFGTALAGNAHNLNQAIRLGSPALEQLRQVLDILAKQNTTLRDINVNSDRIFTQLDNNKADVVRFIQEARDTAAISASRRDDLSADFDRLDDFLHELGPTSDQLAATARASTPLLQDLDAAAPFLNRLALRLPAFNTASETSLVGLGKAAIPGRQALTQGLDEIQALRAAAQNARPVADTLNKFLLDIASPKRAVDVDARAADSCAPGTKHPKSKPCYSTGRKAPTGYTGMEGLLNYAYYQAGALNSFDAVGHLLHFTLYDVQSGPCGSFSTGHDATTGAPGVPAKGGGVTTNFNRTASCVSWLGPNQPGINENLGLAPYNKAVCSQGISPNNAAVRAICDPNGKTKAVSPSAGNKAPAGAGTHRTSAPGASPAGQSGGASGTSPDNGSSPTGVLPDTNGTVKHLRDLLGLPNGTSVKGIREGVKRLRHQAEGAAGGAANNENQAANDLLNFIFGP
jgi:virulence factor Mce-like protein